MRGSESGPLLALPNRLEPPINDRRIRDGKVTQNQGHGSDSNISLPQCGTRPKRV